MYKFNSKKTHLFSKSQSSKHL